MKNDFQDYLTTFFTKYITLQRGFSENSVSSYSDTFILFFRYCQEVHSMRQEKMNFSTINKGLVTEFCDWIEEDRNCSISTRNLRLTALHAFFRYVQSEAPQYAALCRDILEIKMKKNARKPPSHLQGIEIMMLLAEPDVHTKEGLRDLAIMALLYDTGARISELINLCVGDITINATATVRVIGKGNKMRLVPISPETANIIVAYLKSNKIDRKNAQQPLFINRSMKKLTRPGITYILKKYVNLAKEKNPGYFTKEVTAHIIRHSKATHLLLSGVNLVYIRDFLGHSSVITTEHYAKTNPEFMRKAIEKTNPSFGDVTDDYSEEEKQELTEFLKKFRI